MHAARLLVFGIVAAVSLRSTALAETSPLLWDSVQVDSAGTAAIKTKAMPKGWVSTKNVLDPTKSDLRTVYEFEATSCSDPRYGGTISSKSTGTFTAVMNPPNTNPTAYVWDTVLDIAPFQNHWHYYIGCDGIEQVLGCDQAKTASFTITAYDAAGTCHAYQNDAGASVCASDTATAILAAVQDATVTVDPAECIAPGTNCGIGQCERACVQSCNETFPVGGGQDNKENNRLRQQCVDRCPCECKDQRPPECPNNCAD